MKRALLPSVVLVTDSLACLDRANFSDRAAAGRARTMHIPGRQTAGDLLLSMWLILSAGPNLAFQEIHAPIVQGQQHG